MNMDMSRLQAGCFLNSSERSRRCQGHEEFNTMYTRQDE